MDLLAFRENLYRFILCLTSTISNIAISFKSPIYKIRHFGDLCGAYRNTGRKKGD